MRKFTALAASAACLVAQGAHAPAATVQLDSITTTGSEFTFVYGGTLAPTEGVQTGSKLVILDFAGYVDGSIFSPYAQLVGSAELTTSGILLDPAVFDDPSLYNLVFTYTGPSFQVDPAPSGSPYEPINFTGLTARSLFGELTLDGFSTLTVKNEGSAVGSTVFTAGQVGVPAIPEPGTWGMMIVGLAAIGMSARRARRVAVSYS